MQGTELTLTPTVTTLAGTGTSGSADNDTGTLAEFKNPSHITTDGTNLYVADTDNGLIRKIVISTGVVTTLATEATFYKPYGITTDGTNLYVTTLSQLIRKIVIDNASVTTLAGKSVGDAVGTGDVARFNGPQGITTDGTNLYVVDSTNKKIRKIVISTGAVTTLAGSGTVGHADNDNGTLATFTAPTGITIVGNNLYVTQGSSGYAVRKIDISTGAVTTLAGLGGTLGNNSDGKTGTAARFGRLYGITSDGTNLYVSGYSYNMIHKIVIDNASVTTLVSSLSYLNGITTDGTNLYFVNGQTIRKIE
jgi:hypothetical protein